MTDDELSLRALRQERALRERDPAASAYGALMRARRSGIDPIRREAAKARLMRELYEQERQEDPGFRGVRFVGAGEAEFV